MSTQAYITFLAFVAIAADIILFPTLYMGAGVIVAQTLGYDVQPSFALYIASFALTSARSFFDMGMSSMLRTLTSQLMEQEFAKFMKDRNE